MSTPATITIAGVLEKAAIADLVEIALRAGAALMVQPRAIGATSAEVVDAPRQALPPAQTRASRGPKASPRPASSPALDDRVRRVLKDGPVRIAALKAAGLSVRQVRELVDAGAIVATGATAARRYALPGHSAKEAP